jgi:hypothetical protein
MEGLPMTPARFTLDAELEQAMPRRHRWDLRLVEPAQAELVTGPPTPALASAIEQAEAAVKDAETITQYEQAQANLDALRRGQRITAEPAPPPAPLPPTAKGWKVLKTLQRDRDGLITAVEEHWEPS